MTQLARSAWRPPRHPEGTPPPLCNTDSSIIVGLVAGSFDREENPLFGQTRGQRVEGEQQCQSRAPFITGKALRCLSN